MQPAIVMDDVTTQNVTEAQYIPPEERFVGERLSEGIEPKRIDRVKAFVRRHRALTVLSAIGGVVLIGALIKVLRSERVAEAAHRIGERVGEGMPELKKRTRAVAQAARGDIAAPGSEIKKRARAVLLAAQGDLEPDVYVIR